jgi:hypothetical protein
MIQVSAGQTQGPFALDKGDPGSMAQRLATLRARGIPVGNEYLKVCGRFQSCLLYPPVAGPTVSGPPPPPCAWPWLSPGSQGSARNLFTAWVGPGMAEGSEGSPLGHSMGLGAAKEGVGEERPRLLTRGKKITAIAADFALGPIVGIAPAFALASCALLSSC